MCTPVCLSSGVIVDEDDCLDENFAFSLDKCPITNVKVEEKYFPVNAMNV